MIGRRSRTGGRHIVLARTPVVVVALITFPISYFVSLTFSKLDFDPKYILSFLSIFFISFVFFHVGKVFFGYRYILRSDFWNFLIYFLISPISYMFYYVVTQSLFGNSDSKFVLALLGFVVFSTMTSYCGAATAAFLECAYRWRLKRSNRGNPNDV